MKKNVLKVMLGAIVFEVVLACIFILLGNFNLVSARALGSGWIIFGYAIPCLFYSRVSDDEKYKNISIAGTICAFSAALLAILFTWGVFEDNDFFWNVFISLSILVGTFAVICLELSFVSVNELFDKFKKACIILTSIISIWYIAMVIIVPFPDGFLLRLFWVLNVLTVGSFVCTLILALIYKKEMHNENFNQYEESIPNAYPTQQINPNYTQTTNQNNNVPLNNAMPEGNQVNSTMAQNQNLNVPLSNYVAPPNPNPMPNQNQNNNSNLNN